MYKYSKNSLTFLRFLLAGLVIIIHLSDLTNYLIIDEIYKSVQFITSKAIPGFFVISGFLIYMSYNRSKNNFAYFRNRLLRLYPAYIFLLLITVIGGYILVDLSFFKFFDYNIFKYLSCNFVFLSFLMPSFHNVFDSNIMSEINGSLWTLKIEMSFYLIVPILYALLKKYNTILMLTLIYISSYVYSMYMLHLYSIESNQIYYKLSYQLPGSMIYFISGIICFLYFNTIKNKIKYLLPISIIILFLGFDFLEPFALAIVLIYFFIMFNYKINFDKIGDMSYGIYIYHFPIIQVFVYLEVFKNEPFKFVFLITLITLIISFFSWHFIEKPALSLKNKIKF